MLRIHSDGVHREGLQRTRVPLSLNESPPSPSEIAAAKLAGKKPRKKKVTPAAIWPPLYVPGEKEKPK